MELGEITDKAAPSAKPTPSTSSRSLSLSGDAAKEFRDEYNCTEGDELTASVRLKVSSIGNQKLTFDVLSIDDIQEQGGEVVEGEIPAEEPAEAPDEEEAILGYKRPQGNNETPPLEL